jgi:eukaryotic-like serine/threonine-protein kinase
VRICPLCRWRGADDEERCPVDGALLEPQTVQFANTSLVPLPRDFESTAPDVPGAVRAAATDELAGTLWDKRYRLRARIGEGRVGVVYRAEQLSVKRQVAIKLLHPVFASLPEFRARFEREAAAAGKATHPACAAVLDFGTFEGRLYLVMELVEGRLLSDRLRGGKMPVTEAVLITRQILGALRHAHRLGLVHGDVKPANIMLCDTPQTGAQVKLLDLGLGGGPVDERGIGCTMATFVGPLAKLQSARPGAGPAPNSPEFTERTQVDHELAFAREAREESLALPLRGDPGYLSPEQILGVPVDARCDLYAVGVVLFEMAAGCHPFAGRDERALLSAHLETVPPRLRELCPKASLALDAVVDRSLAKDPQDRFQTADEIIAALIKTREARGLMVEACSEARAGSPQAEAGGSPPGPEVGRDPATEVSTARRGSPEYSARSGAPTEADPLVGQVIDGRYRVMHRVGAGGAGVVYQARHLQLGRLVAIKVLHAIFATLPEFRLRFEREALAASRVNHPAAVSIFDFGFFHGQPYLVMEYLRGTLLSARLRADRMSSARAVVITRQILGALRHMHQEGLVHRDIKPANIMLSVQKGTGTRLKLLDFGLAKDLARTMVGDLTVPGIVFGTPGYLSPEQAAGLEVDARSDLFSLGIVLYEMLYGMRDRATLPADGGWQLEAAAFRRTDGRPEPKVSRELQAVLTRSLEYDPALRFQTADEFIQAIVSVPDVRA